MRKTFNISFDESVIMSEVALTFHLATIAVETLWSVEQLKLECKYEFDPGNGKVRISADGEAARSLILVFVAFISREFGEDAYEMTRERGGRR